MCETANQQSISSHVVVYMAYKMRCCWLTFRRCFVNCVHYPEIGHFEMQNRLDTCCLILFIVSGWCKRVWKTVLFRVSHLFSVFWLSFAPGLRPLGETWIGLNRGQYTKESHPFRKHAFIEIPQRSISSSDSASRWSFAYYNGIVGNTSVADDALILHMIS